MPKGICGLPCAPSVRYLVSLPCENILRSAMRGFPVGRWPMDWGKHHSLLLGRYLRALIYSLEKLLNVILFSHSSALILATDFPVGLGLWSHICQSEHLHEFYVGYFADSLYSLCHKGSFLGEVDNLCSENDIFMTCEVVTKHINSWNEFKYWQTIK